MNKNHILLLGAGFSRNWGGSLADEVFGDLLGFKEFQSDQYLRNVLVKCKDNQSGFETALANIQLEYKENQNPENKARLESFNSCLQKIFSNMDESFRKRGSLDTDGRYLIKHFIHKFDAVFTLNQDSLFERCIRTSSCQTSFQVPETWKLHYLPGMMQLENTHSLPPFYEKPLIYIPKEEFKNESSKERKPYFKLHGSYNWQTKNDKEIIMIMGGGKYSSIKMHPILEWYQEQFTEYLLKPNTTRLMIIGYGFRDEHINEKLREAAKNLQIYIIDPNGIGVIPEGLKNILSPTIIGESKRDFKETFSSDNVEYTKIMKFFEK